MLTAPFARIASAFLQVLPKSRIHAPGESTLSPPADLTPVHVIPTDNAWGHAVQWMDFDDRTIYGHHMHQVIKVGAVIGCVMQSDRIALFQITELNWQHDPSDMFFGKVEFIQYKE